MTIIVSIFISIITIIFTISHYYILLPLIIFEDKYVVCNDYIEAGNE